MTHIALRCQTKAVLSIVKSCQSSTRQLQSVCAHSKVVRDAAMMAAVPPLKKSLEALIYRVKVGCHRARARCGHCLAADLWRYRVTESTRRQRCPVRFLDWELEEQGTRWQ